MKAPSFRYHAPRDKSEALDLLAGLENCRVLAGGQSLMPMLSYRLASPDHLIDLNRVSELSFVHVSDAAIRIGAMTRQCDLERSQAVLTHVPLLGAALAHVGHRQTRNRGTIGGSLCHLDPAAELVTAAAAMDATLVAESAAGSRRIPFASWTKDYLSNALLPNEILVEIEFSRWPSGHGYSFAEYSRRKGDFAIVGVAVMLASESDGTVMRASISIGGCAEAPQRLTAGEQALLGTKADELTVKNVARLAATIDAMSDPHVTAEYRRHLARVLTGRGIAEAIGRIRHGAAR